MKVVILGDYQRVARDLGPFDSLYQQIVENIASAPRRGRWRPERTREPASLQRLNSHRADDDHVVHHKIAHVFVLRTGYGAISARPA